MMEEHQVKAFRTVIYSIMQARHLVGLWLANGRHGWNLEDTRRYRTIFWCPAEVCRPPAATVCFVPSGGGPASWQSARQATGDPSEGKYGPPKRVPWVDLCPSKRKF